MLQTTAIKADRSATGVGGKEKDAAAASLAENFSAFLSQMVASMPSMQSSLPAQGEPDFGIPADRMYTAVAMAWQKLNRPEEARESWQRVLTLVPNDAKAVAALRDLNRRFPQKRAKKR